MKLSTRPWPLPGIHSRILQTSNRLSDHIRTNSVLTTIFEIAWFEQEQFVANTGGPLKQSQAETITLEDKLTIALSNYETNLSQNEKLLEVCSKLAINQDQMIGDIGKLNSTITSTLNSR